MINTLFNYQPKGLTKEEVLAEFNNLMSWEQHELLNEIYYKLRNGCIVSEFSTYELKEELNRRGYTVE